MTESHLDKVRGEGEHVPRQLAGAGVRLVRDLLHRAQVRQVPQHLVDGRLPSSSFHYHYHHHYRHHDIFMHRSDRSPSTSSMAVCDRVVVTIMSLLFS